MDPGTADILRDTTNIWNVKEFYEDEPILQIDNLYLIAKTKSGALVIDQHAAHERILYEQFLQSFIAQKIIEQKLAKPITISLPILESQLLLQYKETFSSLGFEFTSVSATEFIFHRIPALFGTRSITQYLLEVVQDLKEQVAIPELDTETHRTIAYLACRNAIKAGEVLTQSERKNILTKLAETSSKYTCPHGRPVILTITSTDLAKMFYRIPAFRNEK
jgi:DNA mismatch repair protein MutL